MALEDTDVLLAFPPLVETNFGSFYPSTAVLAGYLEAEGVRTDQVDLNEEFGIWLLKASADGTHLAGPPIPPGSPVAAAVRWLSRHHAKLFDPEGRHSFGPTSRYGQVLRLLARYFQVDPDTSVLDRTGGTSAGAEIYRQFYVHADFDSRIPDGVSLVGVSVPMGPQLLPALTLAEHLKELRPNVRVVLGGPAISLMGLPELRRLVLAWDAVDAVVRFDGEIPLYELACQTRAGRWEPETVAGVSCRVGDGVRDVPPGAGPPVNSLPAPFYPRRALAALEDPILGITQARGCYWGKCDYCDFVELYDGSPPFRGRRPDSFVAELRSLVEDLGVTQFSFITESIPPAFARRVCAAIIEEGLQIRWDSFAMVDRRFDRDLLALMVESGCNYLTIGMETTITRVLKLVHKSADREENLRFLRDARDVGLPLVINLIPDLPTTTYEEALSALADVAEFGDSLTAVSVYPFEPTRSSNVGRSPELFGLDIDVPTTTTGQAEYALNHLASNDPAMTLEERAEVHRLYRAFAEQVNNRDTTRRGTPVYSADQDLRIAVEDLDLYETEAGVVCTNMRSFGRAVIPARAADMLSPYLDGARFTPRVLRERLSAEVGDRLLKNLDKASMLEQMPIPVLERIGHE